MQQIEELQQSTTKSLKTVRHDTPEVSRIGNTRYKDNDKKWDQSSEISRNKYAIEAQIRKSSQAEGGDRIADTYKRWNRVYGEEPADWRGRGKRMDKGKATRSRRRDECFDNKGQVSVRTQKREAMRKSVVAASQSKHK